MMETHCNICVISKVSLRRINERFIGDIGLDAELIGQGRRGNGEFPSPGGESEREVVVIKMTNDFQIRRSVILTFGDDIRINTQKQVVLIAA